MTPEQIENLRSELAETADEMRGLIDAAESESRDLNDDETTKFDGLHAKVEELRTRIARAEKANALPKLEQRDAAPEVEKRHARAAGTSKPEQVYRPDGDHRFFLDLYNSARGDWEARERLVQHERNSMETRDVTTTALSGFVTPIWMASDYAAYPREGRPFANIVPKQPLPPSGDTITVPRITTAAAVAAQAGEAGAVQETNIDDTKLTVSLVTIAGQQDLSIQALERTFPGGDQIVFEDLRADYDAVLDTSLLSGSGSNAHLGIRAVSSIGTVQYTDASPTAAELTPKVYSAISTVLTNRKAGATHIVMHPRRAAFLASNLSSTFPLFQQGQLNQAAGQQDNGFLTTFAGLPVVLDSNIGITYSDGGSTNEDEIYIVRAADLRLMEGPLRARVLDDVLSGTLQVRLQLFAYSFFVSGRYPTGICKVYGSGLATPSF